MIMMRLLSILALCVGLYAPASAQLTMTGVGGGGPGAGGGGFTATSQQSTDYLARVATAGGTLTNGQKTAYDTMITSIVTALGGNTASSTWPSKMVGLWITAAPATAADGGKLIGVLNLVGNGASSSFPLTETGSNTWTANTGWTGNGTSGYLDTGLTPTGASILQDNKGFGVAINASRTTSSSAIAIGRFDAQNDFIMPLQAASTIQAETGTQNNPTAVNANDSKGIYTLIRPSTATISLFKNAATTLMNAIADDDTGKVDGGTRSYLLGAFNGSGGPAFFSNDRIAAGYVGRAFTSTEAFAIHSAINAYLTGLGVGAY